MSILHEYHRCLMNRKAKSKWKKDRASRLKKQWKNIKRSVMTRAQKFQLDERQTKATTENSLREAFGSK